MSENTLVAKIKTDTARQVAEIVAEQEKAVSAIQAETEIKLEELKKERATALKKSHDHLELVAISRAKQEGKIALQQAKRNQIDAIFAEVETELIQQPADTYIAFFARLVGEMVPKEAKATKISVPKDRVGETTTILKQTDISGEVIVDDKIKAGLLVCTESGIYDVTLGRLMNEARAELEMEIMAKVTE